MDTSAAHVKTSSSGAMVAAWRAQSNVRSAVISRGIVYQILTPHSYLKLANEVVVSKIKVTKASPRMNETSAKHVMVRFMGSCVSTNALTNVLKQQKVLAGEAASVTNVKKDTMGRLVQKSVHLDALHVSWWMVLLLMTTDSFCHKGSATSSAPMTCTDQHVSSHAQKIVRSLLEKPAVQKTLVFVSSAMVANGMATLVISLAMKAALEAHATRTLPHVIVVAKKVGGVTLVRTHAQLVLWADVIAIMESHRNVVQARIQA